MIVSTMLLAAVSTLAAPAPTSAAAIAAPPARAQAVATQLPAQPALAQGIPAQRAADRASDLLPRDALVAAEIPDPAGTIASFLDGEIWKRLDGGRLGKELFRLPSVASGLAGIRAVAAAAGSAPLELLQAAAGDGAAFGLLAPGNGDAEPAAVLVLRATDTERMLKALHTVLLFAGADVTAAEGEQWELPVGDAVAARRGDLFLLSNVSGAVDQLAASREDSLSADPDFRSARDQFADADAWAWMRGDVLRADEANLPQKLDEVGGSLIGGAWNEVLRQAPWAALGLDVEGDRLTARLVAPADSEALRGSHAPFFPQPGEVVVPQVSDQLATLVLQRDLGRFWVTRDLYVTERGVADSVEGDGNLSLVFQRDLGPEVLSWLEPEVLLLAARGPFPTGTPRPEFPTGALGLTIKPGHPEDLPQAFVNAFFAVVTFSNFDNNDPTRPLLQPDMERLAGGARLYHARWRAPGPSEVPLPPRYNVSPALLITQDGRLWLSSSLDLLRRVADAPGQLRSVAGDTLVAHLEPARQILREDRGVLMAKRTLAEGGSREAAERFVDNLLAAADLVDTARLHSGLEGPLFQLLLEVSAQ